MITKFNNFDTVKAYSEAMQLPRGGYVLKILNAKVEDYNGKQALKLSFDIAEGDLAGFYKQKYESNPSEDKKWSGNALLWVPTDADPEWKIRRFKTDIIAFEESNKGLHFDWDEKKFVGLLVGGVFNYREWENGDKSGITENLARFTTVDKIRSGNYKIPDDRLLEHKGGTVNEGFMQIPDGFTEASGIKFD